MTHKIRISSDGSDMGTLIHVDNKLVEPQAYKLTHEAGVTPKLTLNFHAPRMAVENMLEGNVDVMIPYELYQTLQLWKNTVGTDRINLTRKIEELIR